MNDPNKRGFWDGFTLNELLDGETIANPKISPDGKYIAYTKKNKTLDLYIYEISSSIHFQLTEGLKISTGTEYGGGLFCWSQDSQFIYFTVEGKLYQTPINNGSLIALHNFDKAFAPFASSDQLIFSVEHEKSMSLGILDLKSDIQKQWPSRINYTDDFLYDASINPKNSDILLHSYSFPNMSWNGSKIILLKKKEDLNFELITIAGSDKIATSQPKFSPDGSKIAFLSEEDGWLNLWISNSDGEKKVHLVNENVEHAYSTWVTGHSNHVWLSENLIAYTRNEGGFWNLAIVDIETKQSTKINLPDGFYSSLSSDSKGQFLVCHYEDYQTMENIILIDIKKVLNNRDDFFSIITNSGLKSVKNKYFVKPEKITIPTRDGKKAYGLLFLKEDNNGERKNAPVLISIHGGPTGMSSNVYNPSAQYFVSRGYAFLALNYRGSVGYGKEYREMLDGNWGIFDVEDSIDALNYLNKENLVNKNKSAIIGGSAGGYTVLMTLARFPNTFKAGIDLYGVADNFLLAEETHYLESRYTDSLLGPLPEASAKYFERSPIFMAEKIIDPLLVLQGMNDPVVPINQSEMIIEKVKGEVESKFYEGEGHGFKKKENLADAYLRIEKFIKKYVLYSFK